MRKLMLTIVFIHLLAGAAYSLTVPEAFEGYAAKFKFLGVNELLYDRSDIYLADPNAMKDYLAVLKDFRARHDKPQDLLPLLTAKNPKVRTLAIVALYLNENPRALPDIHKLVHDVEPTFDDPPVDQDRVRASGIGPPHEPKTVGAVAQAVIDFYLRAARARDEGFDVYWAKHENRDCCVSWFAVQMLRATRGTSPLPEGSVDRIHALRQAISAAPPESRSWILLQLAMDEYAQYGISHLVPDRELRTLCRGVTSATLRRMIASRYDGDTPGNFTFDDPDLRPADLRWFILEHAKDLLTADDAEVVLAAGNPVAASELRPAMAPTWLPRRARQATAPLPRLATRSDRRSALADFRAESDQVHCRLVLYPSSRPRHPPLSPGCLPGKRPGEPPPRASRPACRYHH